MLNPEIYVSGTIFCILFIKNVAKFYIRIHKIYLTRKFISLMSRLVHLRHIEIPSGLIS